MSYRIGKYILEETISTGAYGICYKARDDNGQKYAIKQIEKGSNGNIMNILNEINMLKVMKSKHSVQFIEYFEKDDDFYIVMELCDGI